MGRGAPKGRRGRAAVLRGGAAGATVAIARFARRVAAAGDGGDCAVCATGRRICVRATGRGGAVRGGNSSRGGSVAAVLARGSGFRAAFLRTGVQSRRAMRCPCGQRRPCAGERFARGVGRGGSCAGKRLARGVPADRGSVSTGHAVSLRTARAVRGERARAAFLRTVSGRAATVHARETASARSSRPAPLPPPASGQEMAGDRVVSVAGDLPCERMRPRAGVCQSLFLRDWVFLPSSIIILKVTASSNERRSSPMARCTFSSRYTSVLRWM